MECVYAYDFGDELVLGSKIRVMQSKTKYVVSLEQETFDSRLFRDIVSPYKYSMTVGDSFTTPSPNLKLLKRLKILTLDRSNIPNNPPPEKLFSVLTYDGEKLTF